MLPSGEIREKFQVYMSLTEETSSVDEVQRLLKQQLGFEVILLDANTSSTDEVSSVSDKVHQELFSNFARRRHVDQMSRFCRVTETPLGGGKGRSFLHGHLTLSSSPPLLSLRKNGGLLVVYTLSRRRGGGG